MFSQTTDSSTESQAHARVILAAGPALVQAVIGTTEYTGPCNLKDTLSIEVYLGKLREG